jgi:hypothetical protein
VTEQEFWVRAREGRTWRENADGMVRCANGACPLAIVWNPGARGVCGTRTAADDLGLPTAFALRVARAADDANDPNRAWLLENLGVGGVTSGGAQKP